MIAATGKAFAVLFQDLHRWSVKSFFTIHWKWPTDSIKPLGNAFERKSIPIDKAETDPSDIVLVSLHFGGDMEPRDESAAGFKGRLFLAEPGDVIYSKIDVRHGAIGVVPDKLPRIAVSSEFPVYHVRPDIALPRYIKLLFRTDAFRRQINSLISGASGRKRVQPSDLEKIEIPLPHPDIQRAIVDFLQKSLSAVAQLHKKASEAEQSIPAVIYKAVRSPRPKPESERPKVLSMLWEDLERWSFNFMARKHLGLLGFQTAGFPIRPLSDFLEGTLNGYCIRPVTKQTPFRMLKLNALQPWGLDLEQTKYVDVSQGIADRFSIRKGDLLICRSVGSYDHVAKCALVTEDHPDILFPDIIIRARFGNEMLPEYAREVMQTPLGRAYFQSNARTAVGMWKIGAEDIRAFPIPASPIKTQHEIVRNVRELRDQIAYSRAEAAKLSEQTHADIEAMILGIKKVPIVDTKEQILAGK